MQRNGITLVVGMGEVGRPLLSILSEQDPTVLGIDIDPVAVDRPVGILHICFPFLDREPFVEACSHYAAQYRPRIMVVNSTVVPGTTRSIEQRTGVPCVYSPVRGKHTKMADDMRLYLKFVAGSNSDAAAAVQAHFQAAGLKSEIFSNPETLELAKLLETTYFGLLIAWAQEMNRFAGAVDADYEEMSRFFSEIGYLPRVMFQPGIIGGHCVMPNIRLLEQRFESPFLTAIRNSNEARKAEIAAPPADSTSRLQPLPHRSTK